VWLSFAAVCGLGAELLGKAQQAAMSDGEARGYR
jgi:hypothetical protein